MISYLLLLFLYGSVASGATVAISHNDATLTPNSNLTSNHYSSSSSSSSLTLGHVHSCAKFSRTAMTTEVGANESVNLVLRLRLSEPATIEFKYEGSHGEQTDSARGVIAELESVLVYPKRRKINQSEAKKMLTSKKRIEEISEKKLTSRKTPKETTIPLIIRSESVGNVIVVINSTSPEVTESCDLKTVFLEINVEKSSSLHSVCDIVGWTYFVLWSVAWYPQIHLNFKLKSVAGFSLDSMMYNNIDDIAYVLYTFPIYCDDGIRDLYEEAHPHSIVPVEINDLAAVAHTTLVLIVLTIQCFYYPRGGQEISAAAWGVAAVCAAVSLVGVILAATGVINWLTYVSMFSYIKIVTSLIKYAPQAWLNYQHKSTEGYSVGNMLLDFTGSFFSLLQMILIAINRSDMWSVFGNPAKFGLGFISLFFCSLYMMQHYLIYPKRRGRYESIINRVGLEMDTKSQDKFVRHTV